MDETKTYIRMCDCPEIQGKHEGWKNPDTFIFPPHQIQEIINDFIMDESKKLYPLFIIFCEENGVKYKTFEQLWVAFYMYEKHSKTWNGKKWEECKHDWADIIQKDKWERLIICMKCFEVEAGVLGAKGN